jgi:hypothetical protein
MQDSMARCIFAHETLVGNRVVLLQDVSYHAVTSGRGCAASTSNSRASIQSRNFTAVQPSASYTMLM